MPLSAEYKTTKYVISPPWLLSAWPPPQYVAYNKYICLFFCAIYIRNKSVVILLPNDGYININFFFLNYTVHLTRIFRGCKRSCYFVCCKIFVFVYFQQGVWPCWKHILKFELNWTDFTTYEKSRISCIHEIFSLNVL